MKIRKKTVFLYLLVGLAVVVFGTLAVSSKGSGNTLRKIETHTVTTDDLVHEVSANGVIESRERETIVSQITSTVENILIQEGDRVRPGQLIVLLDREKILVQKKEALSALETVRRNIKGELLALRTTYLQAKTDLEQTEREATNIKALHEIGSVSDEELSRASDKLELARVAFNSALQKLNFREGRPIRDTRESPSQPDEKIIEDSVEVRQAVAQLESINTNLSNTEIRTGQQGVVIELPVEKGNVIAPGTVIAVVQNPDLLEIVANIDEVDIGYLKEGQDVRVESDSFITKTLTGSITMIAPVIKKVADSRVCEIRVSLLDEDRVAKIGASCSVYIVVDNRKDVPAIPIDLYSQDGDKKYVYVVVEKESEGAFAFLEKREIQTGIIGIDKVEVTEGLKPGDIIAGGNLKDYSEGQIVRIQSSGRNKALK